MTCKIQIGSRYAGPAFDRPALRKLPAGWTLEEARRPTRRWWQSPDRWVGIACAVAYIVLTAQAIAQWVRA